MHREQKSYTTEPFWEVVVHSRSKKHETCLIIILNPGMRLGLESNRGPFGLADECSTTELTLPLICINQAASVFIVSLIQVGLSPDTGPHLGRND